MVTRGADGYESVEGFTRREDTHLTEENRSYLVSRVQGLDCKVRFNANPRVWWLWRRGHTRTHPEHDR